MSASSISKQRIVFTGGSGVAGRHVISKLLEHGHDILNVDIISLDNPKVYTLKADLTDGAQAFNSLSCHFNVSEPFSGPVQMPDAVVHFAGIPRPMLVPDNELFRINTQSSYNIIESACKLGIKKIILASSITVYGVSYAEGDVPYPLFPVDEDCATEPADVYATSKLCMERVAASFARRFPSVDIYVLRIGAVVSPDLYYDKIALYRSAPEKWKAHGWSYSDARDLGNIVHCCLQKDGLGYQVFNAVNDDATFDEETERFLKRVCPETEVTRSMEKHEAPISNGKIREMLGFEEEFGWRKLLGVNKSKEERKQEID